MTNAELDGKLALISELCVSTLRVCDYDKTKIDDGLWKELCKLVKEVEEYV